MKTFLLPDLGEGLSEAEIVSWHVGEGDHVAADQPLLAVETEKAVVELPSPQAGRIRKIFGKPGERIGVGAPLVEFDEGGSADAGAIVGALETAAATPSPPAERRPTVKAAPAVRALAREQGVDLAWLRPTGPGGRITREDVMAAARAKAPAATEGEALSGMRRSMALNMARAHTAVVPATVFDEATIESWWSPTTDVTLRLVRALVAGAAAAPALNAWFDGKALRRHLHREVDLGIAVDVADGLIVPVLRGAGRPEPQELRRWIDTLKAAARSRSLSLADLQGATITLSNFGTLAGRHAALVVIPPQVAIVGAGRIWARPALRGAALGLEHVLPLSLTFDHRAVTGAEAARFLAAMIEDLQRPV